MDKIIKLARHGKNTTTPWIIEMIQKADLKYKIIAGLITAGVGGYTIYKVLFSHDKDNEDVDINEKYFVRRIVKRWWIPMVDTKLTIWFRSLKTTTQMEIELEEKAMALQDRWQYPENDVAHFDPDNLELGPNEIDMIYKSEDGEEHWDLLCLYRTTRMLGEIEKEHILKLWKDVEIQIIQQDEYLFRIGEPDDNVYIVIDGQIEIYCVDESLKYSGYKIENTNHMSLNNIYPGQTIYSVLSFIDILTGHDEPIKTIEAVAVVKSKIFKIPMQTFKKYWFEHPILLTRALRRFLRRIYQVVFVSLHTVLGLSTELIRQDGVRTAVDLQFTTETSYVVSPEDRLAAINGAMNYFNLKGEEYYNIMMASPVVILPKNLVPVKAGQRTSKFVYVFKGELQVSQKVTYENTKSKKETEEVLFYVSRGEAIGGLSYLTDDVNLFTVKVPEKAMIVVVTEEILTKLLDKNPFLIRILAHSVISRLSPFAREMDFGLEWTFIESGNTVYRAGDPPVYTYLVLSGRLQSILTDAKGKNSVKGEYGRNDWIGLVETLTKKFRSKTVLAVRDTELAKIPDGLLNLIKLKFPIVAMRLLDFLGQRVAQTYKNGFAQIKGSRGSSTIALIPTSATVPTNVFTFCLREVYEFHGNVIYEKIKVMTVEDIIETLGEDSLSEDNDYHLTAYLASLEDRFTLIIFVAEPAPNSFWTRKCIKQADTILILVNSGVKRDTKVTAIEKRVNELAPRARKELILIHKQNEDDEDDVYPILTRLWLNKRKWISFHHHISIRSEAFQHIGKPYKTIENIYYLSEDKELSKHSDFARLCRWLCKLSVGVVLGGGGAKGAAHIGVIRVLKELDIPIDYIAGVSIGAFVGGLYAMTQDIDLIEETVGDWFNKIAEAYRYFCDMTFPLLSIFKGEAFNNSIKACFGDVQIEDLKIPFFTVTTDMTANRARVHKSGPLWRYTRASMTLSGYFPPICDLDGHFLMDGGYTNLVPANLMRSFGAGWILGIDVSATDPVETTNYGDQLSGVRAVLPHLIPYIEPFKIPNYFALQQQLSFLQSALYMEIIKEMDRSSIYIRPPLDFYATSDFPFFKNIMGTGYCYASQIFRKCSCTDPIEVIWNKIAQELINLQDQLHKYDTIQATKSEKVLENQTEYTRRQTSSNSRRR